MGGAMLLAMLRRRQKQRVQWLQRAPAIAWRYHSPAADPRAGLQEIPRLAI